MNLHINQNISLIMMIKLKLQELKDSPIINEFMIK